jgi:hypothetical protein
VLSSKRFDGSFTKTHHRRQRRAPNQRWPHPWRKYSLWEPRVHHHFGSMSFSAEGNESDVVFVGMAHSGSPSLHTIFEESADEDDTTSSGGGSSGFSISRGCNVVTLIVPITRTSPLEGTPTPLTIPTVLLWTVVS